MAELIVEQRTDSPAVPPLTEDTELAALLSAILGDKPEGTRAEAARPRDRGQSGLTMAAAIDASLPSATSASGPVRDLELPRPAAPRLEWPSTPRATFAQPGSIADLPGRTLAKPSEPGLSDIDAFLDARIHSTGTPRWSTFAPDPGVAVESDDPDDGGKRSGLGGGLRQGAFAAALGLSVLAIWMVLR